MNGLTSLREKLIHTALPRNYMELNLVLQKQIKMTKTDNKGLSP